MKEYKREINRYLRRERDDYPPYPDNYFCEAARAILDLYRRDLIAADSAGESIPSTLRKKLSRCWITHGQTRARRCSTIGSVWSTS